MLPLFARSCFVALGLALDACRVKGAGVVDVAPALDDVAPGIVEDLVVDDVAPPVLDTPAPDVSPPTPPSTVKPTSTDPVARWHDAVRRAGSASPSDVARAVGVSRQTASTWKRQAGDNRPQAMAA